MAAHNSGFRCISSLFPSFSRFSPSQHSGNWLDFFAFISSSRAHYAAQHIRQTEEEFLFLAQRPQLQSLHENADRVSLLYIYSKQNLKVSVSFFFSFFSFLFSIQFGLVTNERFLSRKKEWMIGNVHHVEPASQPNIHSKSFIAHMFGAYCLWNSSPKQMTFSARFFLWHLKGDLRHVAASFQYYRNERYDYDNTMTMAAAQKMVKFSLQPAIKKHSRISI